MDTMTLAVFFDMLLQLWGWLPALGVLDYRVIAEASASAWLPSSDLSYQVSAILEWCSQWLSSSTQAEDMPIVNDGVQTEQYYYYWYYYSGASAGASDYSAGVAACTSTIYQCH
eukprot:733960-Amphidinium_carterae.1